MENILELQQVSKTFSKSDFTLDPGVDPGDILAYRKRDFQIDVLVRNGKEAERKYKDVVIDHVSVDEIMLLLVKGE